MATPPETFAKENSNYARLCCLLIDIGTQCLRDRFNKVHPPQSLCSALATYRAQLLPLWKRKIINQNQWDTLFPPASSSVSSKDFDITLLIILLRNICSLPSPVTGWDNFPSQADESVEADIARLKYYRNNIFAHAKTASIDDVTYNTQWFAIQATLLRLGGTSYKATIDNLKAVCLDPEVEENYKGLLEQWKKDDTNIKEKLEEVIKTLDDLKQEKEKAEELNKPFNQEVWSKELSELPDQRQNIHGHEKELAEIVDTLTNRCDVAVVLVSGTAGIGKTTVAIQASYKLKDASKNIKFCDLRGACSSEDEMVRAILNDCDSGYQQTNTKPRHVLLQWCRRLKSETILVLDNAEDVLAEDSLKEAFAKLLGDMRKYTPQRNLIKFLITSRRSDIDSLKTSLNVSSIKVGPLNEEESIQILNDGAKLSSGSYPETQRKFSKVAALCEHIPLTLRLAGPLLSSDSEYSFEELIRGLDRSPTKTLQLDGMMEIAFEQLDETLQHALVRLSVFVSSFDKEAAKALLGDRCPELLTNLRRRSWIEKQNNRYHLHLLIRDYARQKGKAQFSQIVAQGRHSFLKHFLALILKNTRTYWQKDGCRNSLDLFDCERLNFEYALKIVSLEKNFDSKELETVVNGCRLVAPYIGDCVPVALYEDFLNALLRFAQSQEKVISTVEILCLLYHEGRKRGGAKKELQDEAIKLHDENIHLFHKTSLSEVFYVSHYGRYLSQDCNQREEAQPVLREALSIFETGNPESFEKENPEYISNVARILGQMGHNAKELQNIEEACGNYLKALELLKDRYGNHILTVFAHKDVADYYLFIEQFSMAEENYQKAIGILEEIQIADHKEAIPIFKNWGICFEKTGKFDESRLKYTKGSDIADTTIEGNHKWKVWIKTYLALLLYTRYPEDVSTANTIATEVLQMGKELKLEKWTGKKELEERFQTR